MKKLMIAAAIVCAAAFAQAATIKWSTGTSLLTDKDGTVVTDGTVGSLVLVIMNSADGWDSATEILTKTSAGKGGTTLVVATRGTVGQVSGNFQYNWTGTAADLIKDGDYLALMYKDENEVLHKLTYTSGADKDKDVEGVLANPSVTRDADIVTGAVIAMTGNFTYEVGSVPEPTSGLLLLLGVAGLALKRRRA